MTLRNYLRGFFIKFLKEDWIDYIRYVSFSSKIKNLYATSKIHEFFELEMEILPELLGENFNLGIDMGANYGAYTFFLSKLGNQDIKIFSFEPIPRTYKILLRVIKKFNLKNVEPVNMALGNEEGHINMTIPNNMTGLAHIYSEREKKGDESQRIKKARIGKLDNFDNILNKKVDFIKCDVEGKELDVLKGAVRTIENSKPIILCEIEQRHAQKYGIDANESLSFLLKRGYKAFIYRDKKLVDMGKMSDDYGNYFFIHESQISSINPALFS